MVSPSPVPPYLRVMVVSACENASNILAFCSGVTPIPLSFTSKYTVVFPAWERFFLI